MSDNYYNSICIKAKQEGDNFRVQSYPPLRQKDKEIEEHIKDAVFRCMNFSSKLVNVCELTNIKYDSSDEGLIVDCLKGAKSINMHHCCGNIFYHIDNKKYFDYANLYFECQEKIIQNHSWNNKIIKIQRSNGDIIDATIGDHYCIRYFLDKIMIYVTFILNDEDFYKWVPFENYFSNRLNNEVNGILNLNPELKTEELVLYKFKHPEWMDKDREEWEDLFDKEFKKLSINYHFEEKN